MLGSVTIVPETSQGVVIRFGKPVRIVNRFENGERFGEVGAGLNAKIPFAESIVWIDKRVRDLDMDRQQVLSIDQRRLEVDAFARYRVVDPLRMFIAARSEDRVEEALKPILGSQLRNELGKRPFASMLSPEREGAMENIRTGMNRIARQYGVVVVDVRIKKADLPDGTPLELRLCADAQRAPAGSPLDPRRRRQDRADHPRLGRRRSRANLCRKLRQGPGILRFLPRDAVVSATFIGDGTNKSSPTSIIMSPNSEYLKEFAGR